MIKFRDFSPATLEKLSWLQRNNSSPERLTAILEDLGGCGEPGLAPYLASYALSSHSEIQSAARGTISTLLSHVPVFRLSEYDDHARSSSIYWEYKNELWREIAVSEIGTLTQESDFGLLALASMHANGRVREAALRLLAKESDGRELPFILLRANDWVEPIRRSVTDWLSARIRPDYALPFLTCLPLVLQLAERKRSNHDWLTQAVGGLLTSNECAATLQQGLRARETRVRRACLRFIDAHRSIIAEEALVQALDDPDSMTRLWAEQRLLKGYSAKVSPALLEELEADPFMWVRREALAFRVKEYGAAAMPSLQRALLDRHASIRGFARFHLKGKIDAAEFYRRAIMTTYGPKLVAAVNGIGESGADTDVDQIVPFFDSPRTKLREATVLAAGHLAPVKYMEQLFKALSDDSAKVSRAASGVLEPIAASIGSEKIRSLLAENPNPAARKSALSLGTRLGYWTQLPLLLFAIRDSSENVSLHASAAIKRWLARYNRNFVRPSASEISAATRELLACQSFLNTWTKQELGAIIRAWSE